MSMGSENHDFMGIALFGKHRYAPGELSMMNICEKIEDDTKCIGYFQLKYQFD